MPILVTVTGLSAVAWVYLLAGHGGFWRTGCRLPPGADGPGPSRWPDVTAVVPARDEAAILPETLPTLLGQGYPGRFRVVLVDDSSTDGTATVAKALARQHSPAGTAGDVGVAPSASGLGVAPDAAGAGVGGPGHTGALVSGGAAAGPVAGEGRGRLNAEVPADLVVVAGSPPPPGWAGKVWAMAQGAEEAGECGYLLFTDADIAFEPGVVTALVRAAVGDGRALVSQMALLRAGTRWERWIVPAFVYFFAQLYPFRRVGSPRSRTAAAAGGCMLVHRETLAAAGELAGIRGARIDDVALARLLKRGAGARCWLGFTTAVHSRRPYPSLGSLWDMVARSAYTQLRYSPVLLALVVAGLAWLYLLPPVAVLGGLAALAAGAGAPAAWWAGAGAAGWALMTVTYLPVLRLYGLSGWRAPGLPAVAALYAAMTVGSARRHHAGRGGEWKGRTIPAGHPRS